MSSQTFCAYPVLGGTENRRKGPGCLGAFARVAVLPVAALACLAQLRGSAFAAVGLGQVQAYEPRSVEVLLAASKHAREAAGQTREKFHAWQDASAPAEKQERLSIRSGLRWEFRLLFRVAPETGNV